MNVRASSLPLAFTCPGSLRTGAMTIEGANPAGDIGTAAHDCMAQFVAGAAFGELDYAAIARRHGVEESDLRPLAWYGSRAWYELAPSMPGAVAELALEADLIADDHTITTVTGHIDAVAVSDDVAACVDWKSGRKDKNHYHQVMGYCALVFDDQPGIDRIHASVVWLRAQEIETMTITRADAGAWCRRLLAEVVNWSGRYTTGAHCVYCPRSHDCPAVVASQRRDIEVIEQWPGGLSNLDAGLASLEPADRVEMWRRAKAITAVCARVVEAVRANVALSGGTLDAGDGHVLRITEESAGRKLDTAAAWTILQDALSDDELASCVDVRISKVESIVAKNAGRGQGATAKKVLSEKLEAANAVTRNTREVLAEVRVTPEPKEIK